MQHDPTTPAEKAIAATAAFGLATLAFLLAPFLISPVLGLYTAIGAPDIVQPVVIMLLLFGLPVVVAIATVAALGHSFARAHRRAAVASA